MWENVIQKKNIENWYHTYKTLFNNSLWLLERVLNNPEHVLMQFYLITVVISFVQEQLIKKILWFKYWYLIYKILCCNLVRTNDVFMTIPDHNPVQYTAIFLQ